MCVLQQVTVYFLSMSSYLYNGEGSNSWLSIVVKLTVMKHIKTFCSVPDTFVDVDGLVNAE